MMQVTQLPKQDLWRSQVGVPQYWQAKVKNVMPGKCYELDSGEQGRCAFSCLIEPQKNDLVLCFRDEGFRDEASADSPVFILSILRRENIEDARLSVPGCQELTIAQPQIKCLASRELEMGCLGDIKLTSAKGSIQLRAINLVQTLAGSIIESARERITNAEFVQFCASFLTRIHSKQTVFTADADIKIDAERVNLG